MWVLSFAKRMGDFISKAQPLFSKKSVDTKRREKDHLEGFISTKINIHIVPFRIKTAVRAT